MKILVVTANFAPRGASPAIRTVHLVKYLHRLGCEIEVVTYDEGTLTLFSPNDPGLAAKVPAPVRVHRVGPGPLRRRLYGRKSGAIARRSDRRSQLRNPAVHLLWPDPHAEAIVGFGACAARRRAVFQPDVLLTHAYPYSMHLVGCALARRDRAPAWVADYGDPWSGGGVAELARPAWRLRLDRWAERQLLGRASLVTLTTEATRDLYARQFPGLASRLAVVSMGYDPEDFLQAMPVERSDDDRRRIWLVHAGRLYHEARNPDPFVEALESLLPAEPAVAEALRVFMVGELDAPTRKRIADSPARRLFREIPWVPYADSLAWMLAGDRLLLFGNRGDLQVPGKLYNYIGAGTPITMFSESATDPCAGVLAGVPGAVVIPNDRDSIRDHLREVVRRGPGARGGGGAAAAGAFSWPDIARSLLERLEECTGGPRA